MCVSPCSGSKNPGVLQAGLYLALQRESSKSFALKCAGVCLVTYLSRSRTRRISGLTPCLRQDSADRGVSTTLAGGGLMPLTWQERARDKGQLREGVESETSNRSFAFSGHVHVWSRIRAVLGAGPNPPGLCTRKVKTRPPFAAWYCFLSAITWAGRRKGDQGRSTLNLPFSVPAIVVVVASS